MTDYRRHYEREHASNRNFRVVNHGVNLLGHYRHLIADGQRLLDVGCGNGKLCCWLADQGVDVTGVDVAAGGYRRPYPFHQRDLTAADWDLGHYDLGLCFDVIEHIAPADLPAFLAGYFAATDRQVFSVAHFAIPDDASLHLTVWPRQRWIDYLGPAATVLHADDRTDAAGRPQPATLFYRH